jgi:hypothetical protein
MGSHRLYRAFLALYPADFRREYGDDMVQHLDDLTADSGPARARTRVAIDLLVTVPRYRLESLMDERRGNTVLWVALGGLLVAGAAAVLTGLFPALVMLVAAAALATAQRSRLARSLRALDPDLRRRRFRRSALCAVVFAASIVGYVIALADDEIGGFSLIFFNLVGTTAMVAAGVLLVMAMLTPKEPVVRARGVGT